ncbi:MAG: PD40 domain-containing protein [Bacteroidetes bacterium]|nr:PD40 domain-containing protein [Bacteroidota bacterium]
MKNLKQFVLLIFVITSGLSAQVHANEYDTKVKEAGKNFDNGKFDMALPLYLDLAEFDSLNPDMNFRIGICYLNSRTEKQKSVYYLEKAIACINKCSIKEDKANVMAFKALGDAYHLTYKFDRAIVSYEKFKSLLSDNKKDQALIPEVDRKIEMCKVGKQLVASPIKVKIENMGEAINSPFADYSPVLTADESTLIFTTRRAESTGRNLDYAGLFFEDIYISHKKDSLWSKAVSINRPINTIGNEATVGISIDGQTILIYKDDNGDGNIYSTSLNGELWSIPKKLNDNINTTSWEPSAFISADGNTLYFTSNREGGFGGRDIYLSKKTTDGDWGIAVNLGSTINTPFDEDAPFIHPDGITLYFTSNGHKTMGGFDIFSTSMLANNEWTTPVNIGFPINTTDDDIYYNVSADNKRAYYSSFKEGGLGEKDNYAITFYEYKESPLTVLKGGITDIHGKVPKIIEIIVTDNETGELVGIYHSNSKTGEYLFILPSGKNYNITHESEGYLFQSVNMDVTQNKKYYFSQNTIQLEPIAVGSKVVLNNIFFDFDKATLRNISNVELSKLYKLLTKNPGMVVEISGHTDSKGSEEYNVQLSEERAQSVVNYLIEKGINKNQMVAKGYGKSDPAANNINADGSDNPENRQLNRRAELKIIKIKSLKK